MTGSAQTFPWI